MDLLGRLQDDLAHRRIESGMRYLEEHRGVLDALNAGQPGAALLAGYLAQWVDIGFADAGLVKCLLTHFPKELRPSLPLREYLHLRMAEGLVEMSEENFNQAMRHFEFVGSIEEAGDRQLLAISNFWMGRCLRQEGRYDDALSYTVRARDFAHGAGYEKIAAVIQVLESWLCFQKGKLTEARRILEQAEASLSTTDDFVSLGNIQSAYGRIARREGKYERALEHFERAIELYKRRDARHRNLARSLANIAWVKRLIVLQLQKKLDREAARRKAAGMRQAAPEFAGGQDRSRIERLRAEAFGELDEAFAIYAPHDNHRGMGAVHINRGFLFLDSGELDRAAAEASEAFRLGEGKADYLLMARARILQCMVENASLEEQIVEPGGENRHAQRADEFARDAVEFARHTQNPRLLARAYIWQGMTFSNEFFENTEAARQCCDAALALLKPESQDYIWEDLQELRSRILEQGRVDTVLQEWSQGLVGGKTFQQIAEEFAGIVIPKVWEREGRKVSRVAAKLSISPKKVRRILQSAGLLDNSDRD